jgi:hypothetical protein
MNTHVRDNEAALRTTPYCLARTATGASLTNNVAAVAALDLEDYDNDVMHDTVTNNSRVTIKHAGAYYIFAEVAYTGNATGVRRADIQLNGASTSIAFAQQAAAASTTTVGCAGFATFAVNDYIEVFAFQNSGGALTFTAARLGAVWVSATGTVP